MSVCLPPFHSCCVAQSAPDASPLTSIYLDCLGDLSLLEAVFGLAVRLGDKDGCVAALMRMLLLSSMYCVPTPQ